MCRRLAYIAHYDTHSLLLVFAGHDGSQSTARLEEATRSPAHYLVWSAKEGQGETSIDTLNPSSGQIAVEEGRDALPGYAT